MESDTRAHDRLRALNRTMHHAEGASTAQLHDVKPPFFEQNVTFGLMAGRLEPDSCFSLFDVKPPKGYPLNQLLPTLIQRNCALCVEDLRQKSEEWQPDNLF